MEEWVVSHSSFYCEERERDMKKLNAAVAAEELLTPVIEGLGYRLWDLEFKKVGPEYKLEITIDSDNGITIEDCEKVHRAIDPVLDEADMIETSYRLEVSSPGIERELRTDAHILTSIGEVVEVRFFAPRDGKKSVIAVLMGYENGNLSLKTKEDEDITLPRKEVSHMHTVFFEEE